MVVANNPYPQDTRVRNEAETLIESGHRVSVVALRRSDQPASEVVNGVRVYRFDPPRAGASVMGYVFEFVAVTLLVLARLLWLRMRTRIDIVHLHNPPDTLVLSA